MEFKELTDEEFDQRCAIIDAWVEKEGIDPMAIYIMLSKHLEDENGKIKPEYRMPLRVLATK